MFTSMPRARVYAYDDGLPGHGALSQRSKNLGPRFFQTWERSVFRRSLLVQALAAPAALFNLALLYLATSVLEAASFGIFYLAIIVSNVLFAPSVVLTVYYSRHFVQVAQAMGEDHAIASIGRYVVKVARWSGLALIAQMVALLLLGKLVGVTAFSIIMLIVLIDYFAYLAETGRCAMQGLKRFITLAMYTLGWLFFRMVLGLGGLYLFDSIKAGLLGIAVSPLSVFLPFAMWLWRRSKAAKLAPDTRSAPSLPTLPPLARIGPVAIGYSVFALVMYLDVVIAYLSLGGQALGTYTASSVLPKGIVLLTLPIVQVVFPIMVGSHHNNTLTTRVIINAGLASALAPAVLIAIMTGLGTHVCGGAYGVRNCDPTLMAWQMGAVIPLCLIRLLVLLEFARHRDWLPGVLAVPAAAWAVLSLFMNQDTMSLAFSFLFCVILGFLMLMFLSFRRTVGAAPRSRRNPCGPEKVPSP